MSEERKRIKIVIDEFTGGSFRYEGGEIEGIRIFPACKYADCGSRTLSPSELNEAVQMWLNRSQAPKSSGRYLDKEAVLKFIGDYERALKEALAAKDAEIARLKDNRKEPELFICPAHGESEMCPTCHHSKPHEHMGVNCTFDGVQCKKCIPYKEPVNVKGDLVNSLQEEGKSPIQHLQDRVLELEQHQGRDRADLMEKIRVLESQAHAAYCCNDDAAKGIGALTLRVDKMEKDVEILKDSFVTPHGIDIANIFTRVSRLETDRVKKVKDS